MTMTETKTKKRRSRPVLRKFEALVGVPLADQFGKIGLKQSKLVGPKKVFLPKSRVHMNYFEREAVPILTESETNEERSKNHGQQHTPTLLLLHGIGSSSNEFFVFLKLMDIPAHVRILIPEHIGHGEDLKRVKSEGPSFQHPNGNTLLETTSEFLDLTNAGPNCNALGTSLGGALLYFLKAKRPDVIRKTILVAPALPYCLTEPFVGGLMDGTHSFMDFQSREDVKQMFRNFLWTDPKKRNADIYNETNKNTKRRQKKDPLPKFGYEVIYRLTLRDVPEGHFRALQNKLLLETRIESENDNDDEMENKFAVTTDVDPDSERLLVWPEEDQICSFERGRDFFGPSISSGKTTFEAIPDCGHVFHANGKGIYEVIVPMVKPALLDFSTGQHEPVLRTQL